MRPGAKPRLDVAAGLMPGKSAIHDRAGSHRHVIPGLNLRVRRLHAAPAWIALRCRSGRLTTTVCGTGGARKEVHRQRARQATGKPGDPVSGVGRDETGRHGASLLEPAATSRARRARITDCKQAAIGASRLRPPFEDLVELRGQPFSRNSRHTDGAGDGSREPKRRNFTAGLTKWSASFRPQLNDDSTLA